MTRTTALAATLATLLGLLVAPAEARAATPADLVARGTDGRLWLFPNDGATPYPWENRRVVGTDWNTVNVMTFGDMTLDGSPDIVAREPGLQDGTLWLHVYDAAAPASPWTKRIWGGYGWNIAVFMAVGDVTGDARPDIVIREADGRMWLYPHSGRTTTSPFDTRTLIGFGWQRTTAMMLGDVTLDGRLDLVTRDTDGLLWILSPPAAGQRAWSPRVGAPYPAGAGWDRYVELDLGDVDGDGRTDVLARDNAGTLWLYRHDGAAPGTNPYPGRVPAGGWWSSFTALLPL